MAAFERISRNLQCPVCLELLSDPKPLSCSHTFCKKCLSNILACSSQKANNSIACPICRKVTTLKHGNIENLVTSFPMKGLIDDVRNSHQLCDVCDTQAIATRFCVECGKNMCNACIDDHSKWSPNLKHRLESVEDIREGRVVLDVEVYCQEHPRRVCTDVCITCNRLICERCRVVLKHKDHECQDAEVYNASSKESIKSLQAQGEMKVSIIKNHLACIEKQKKEVNDHIDSTKDQINQIYQELPKILNDNKAVLDNQLETQRMKQCQRLDGMKSADDAFVTSIDSASAGKSLNAPLGGDTVIIRSFLSDDLKSVLRRDNPKAKSATDVADRAKQLIFTPTYHPVQMNIGEVKYEKCELECSVPFSNKDSMNAISPIPHSRIAVGSRLGGIEIFSADGQLQETVLKDVKVREIGVFSDGRFVVRNCSNTFTLYTQAYEKLKVSFDSTSNDDGASGCHTIDSNDLIYVSYKSSHKIKVFSPAGGKAIREIPFKGYGPEQITSYNDSLLVKDSDTIILISKQGSVQHTIRRVDSRAFAAVSHNNSILIAWVKHFDGLVSVEEYNSELNHIKTLISDLEITKSERGWYYLRVFKSGEIAFCTPDRLYILKVTTTLVEV